MTHFFLMHCLQTLILPPGLNLVIALLGLIFYWYNRLISMSLIGISIFTLWLFSAPFFAYNLLDTLQNEYPTLSQEQLLHPKPHTAILILGGGNTLLVEQNNKEDVSINTLERLYYAVYLSENTHLPIIVSGGKVNNARKTGANLMSESLRHFNINSTIEENNSTNTLEESQFMPALLKEHHIDQVYLVTHAWHMPRSVKFFKRAGVNIIPAPMGYQVYDYNYTILSFLPNINALSATTQAIHEYVGMWES